MTGVGVSNAYVNVHFLGFFSNAMNVLKIWIELKNQYTVYNNNIDKSS